MHSNKVIRLHTPTHTRAHTYVYIHTHTHTSTYTHTLLGLFKLHNLSCYAERILHTKILHSLCCNAHLCCNADLASPSPSYALQTSCPHQELLGGGASTPGPLFCLICTIISKKSGLFDLYQNTLQVLAARYFLVTGFDTRWAPRRVSSGTSKMYYCKIFRCDILLCRKHSGWQDNHTG